MDHEIVTTNGIYQYKYVKLFYGRKIINLEVSKNNLLDFKILLDLINLDFGIIYGTLLGAVREKNFIEYDEDIDVFILDENRELFLSLLFKFRNIGFEVARYEKDLLSIIRNDDYIDIYFFKKSLFGRRTCNRDSLSTYFTDTFGKIVFLDKEFNTPNDPIAFLEKAYGKDWRTPKQNTPAVVTSFYTKLKILLHKVLPKFVIIFLKTLKCNMQKVFKI